MPTYHWDGEGDTLACLIRPFLSCADAREVLACVVTDDMVDRPGLAVTAPDRETVARALRAARDAVERMGN